MPSDVSSARPGEDLPGRQAVQVGDLCPYRGIQVSRASGLVRLHRRNRVKGLIVLAREPFSDLGLDLAQVQSHFGTRGRIDDPLRERVRNPCPITRLWRNTLPPL